MSSSTEKKIAIVGVGSAGLLTAAHLCTWLDKSWRICIVHDPRRKILGIGESTNGAFISVLERATNFSIAQAGDLGALDATLKFGSRFSGWREHDWVNPLLSGNIAIHFNNRRLKDFVFERLARNWPDQFEVLEADVLEVQNFADHVELLCDNGKHHFDYVVDCMGSPTTFVGYTLSDCTLVNRCRVHTLRDYEYQPFTDHIATQDGWMFGVPLAGYKTLGYLYDHRLTDDDAADLHFRQLLGVECLDAGQYDRQYDFRCYYANELISGRVAKNGNKALFFEPLLANSMFLYIYAARLIYDQFVNGREASLCNGLFTKAVREVENVISYYYKGGSNYDTDFWRASSDHASQRLEGRAEFHEYLRKLTEFKRRGTMYSAPPYAFSPQTWQIVDDQMGYRTFDLSIEE